MGRILCAWEFGGDLGHIRRLAALARALRGSGHEVIVAAGDLAHAAPILAGNEWHQAPLIKSPATGRPPVSATDVLLDMGLGDAAGVAAALRAWDQLLRLADPDVLVADYAPMGMLAARAQAIPRANIGSGFSLPPRARPMPALRDWHAIPATALEDIDARLLGAVNHALEETGSTPLAAAENIFDSDLELLCTFAEIDPFGPRSAEYLGPLDDSASGLEVEWRHPHPRVLAYLKPRHALFPHLARALAALDCEAIIAAPGLRAEHAAELTTGRVRVVADTVNLAKLLPEADFALGHGTAGFTGRVLAAGVPQAMLPLLLEQYLVARRVEAAGAGVTAIAEKPIADVGAWLGELLASTALRDAARRVGSPLAGHDARSSAARAAARVTSLAGS